MCTATAASRFVDLIVDIIVAVVTAFTAVAMATTRVIVGSTAPTILNAFVAARVGLAPLVNQTRPTYKHTTSAAAAAAVVVVVVVVPDPVILTASITISDTPSNERSRQCAIAVAIVVVACPGAGHTRSCAVLATPTVPKRLPYSGLTTAD